MTHGMIFAWLRLIIIAVALLTQFYIFLRIRRVIKATGWSKRSQVWTSAGVGAAITILFVMNAYIIVHPIPWVDPPLVAELALFYPPAVWTFGSLLAALLLSLTALFRGIRRVVRRWMRALKPRKPAIPVDLERRNFLQAGASSLIAAPLILSGYGATFGSMDYEVQELSLPLGRSLRVVQLSDIHAGIYMTRRAMRRYADQVAALQPDVFVLTGDYVSNSIEFLPACVEEMARVRARYGTFASMGNHDRWCGKLSEIIRTFREHHITFLLNAHRVIQTEQGSVAIAGIDDLLVGRPDLNKALHGLDPGMPTILLSHRPEIFPQAATQGIPLTLSGHYHGGQIKLSLPGVDLSLAHLRSPYPEGLYQIKDCHLYVNRGIGTTFTPVRLNAPPEVTLFHLT
jgi:uncharacterized protein